MKNGFWAGDMGTELEIFERFVYFLNLSGTSEEPISLGSHSILSSLRHRFGSDRARQCSGAVLDVLGVPGHFGNVPGRLVHPPCMPLVSCPPLSIKARTQSRSRTCGAPPHRSREPPRAILNETSRHQTPRYAGLSFCPDVRFPSLHFTDRLIDQKRTFGAWPGSSKPRYTVEKSGIDGISRYLTGRCYFLVSKRSVPPFKIPVGRKPQQASGNSDFAPLSSSVGILGTPEDWACAV